jgi:hypothetical protein
LVSGQWQVTEEKEGGFFQYYHKPFIDRMDPVVIWIYAGTQ